MTTVYLIHIRWVETTRRWTATSAEIPDWLLVARTLEELSPSLKHTVPKLLRENGLIDEYGARVPPFSVVVEPPNSR